MLILVQVDRLNMFENTVTLNTGRRINLEEFAMSDDDTRLYALDYYDFTVIHCFEILSTFDVEYYKIKTSSAYCPTDREYFG